MKKVKDVLLKKSDEPNVNGTIYSSSALKKIHEQIQENKGRILGQLGVSNDTGPNFKNAMLCVDDSSLKNENTELYVDVTFLKDHISLEKFQLAMLCRGVIKNGLVVEENLKLISVDLILK